MTNHTLGLLLLSPLFGVILLALVSMLYDIYQEDCTGFIILAGVCGVVGMAAAGMVLL